MLTIRRFQKGDEEILSIMIRRTLREVNYTSPKSELDSPLFPGDHGGAV